MREATLREQEAQQILGEQFGPRGLRSWSATDAGLAKTISEILYHRVGKAFLTDDFGNSDSNSPMWRAMSGETRSRAREHAVAAALQRATASLEEMGYVPQGAAMTTGLRPLGHRLGVESKTK